MNAPGADTDIYLYPGDWCFADQHARIRTTLGSCIAITLWHPERKIGGMCHYMLPGSGGNPNALNGRYAQDAVQLLVAETQRLGTQPGDYQVKLFGGASMFRIGPQGSSVALRNVQAANQLMQQLPFNVVARSLGGHAYRQLVFSLADGDVWVRQGQSDESVHEFSHLTLSEDPI